MSWLGRLPSNYDIYEEKSKKKKKMNTPILEDTSFPALVKWI